MNFNREDIPQHMIDRMTPEDRKSMGLISTEEGNEKAEKGRKKYELKKESEIQNEVESWLILNGFERRTPDSIKRGKPKAGYFIHLHEAKRNPILLDLLILSNSGRYFELELKTAHGAVTEEQKCLVDYGGSIARSSKEAIDLIKEWGKG